MKAMSESAPQASELKGSVKRAIKLILKAIPVGMGVGVTALAILGEIDTTPALLLIGIGLACLGISAFEPAPADHTVEQ